MSPPEKQTADRPQTKRRKYHSPLRKQQLAETRERIITAGAEIVHSLPSWDWKNLSAGVVGERAGISERTVHRHFSTERSLRAAVLQRLVEESGIDLAHLELDDFSGAVGNLFRYLQSFSMEHSMRADPVLEEIDRHRIEALLQAVTRAMPDSSDEERKTAAALLDILWQPQVFERLTSTWNFDTDRAVDTISWLIELIKGTIHNGRIPGPDERKER